MTWLLLLELKLWGFSIGVIILNAIKKWIKSGVAVWILDGASIARWKHQSIYESPQRANQTYNSPQLLEDRKLGKLARFPEIRSSTAEVQYKQ